MATADTGDAATAEATIGAAAAGTIDAAEAGFFGALAGDWWDPAGRSAMLHRINPVRLRYIRDAVLARGGDSRGRRLLAGTAALDVGCGAGLLAEPLARLGAAVTGVDAAPENIAAARAHAVAAGSRSTTAPYRSRCSPAKARASTSSPAWRSSNTSPGAEHSWRRCGR